MNPLVTPKDWAHICRCQATEMLGTPEAAAKLAEAKRYELLAAELEALRAECEALQKDAERYRWIRRPVMSVAEGKELIRIIDCLSEEVLDAAIDAAEKEANT